MGLHSEFLSQKLASLIHVVSLCLIKICSYFSRLQKYSFSSKKNDRDDVTLAEEEEGENDDELHLKFKFPTFDEFSRKGRDYSSSTRISSASALIEVLTTFPNEGGEREKEEVNVERNWKIDAHEVEEDYICGDESESAEFYSERSSDGFLCDEDLGERLEVGSDENRENNGYLLSKKVDEEQDLLMDSDYFLSEKDGFEENSDKLKNEDGFVTVDETEGGDDDDEKLEELWEHHELIEQLEMELRKVNKATSVGLPLPTIIEEESESSPRIKNDDFKVAWKIDDNDNEKLQQQEYSMGMVELHKLHKSYTQMMRKFDILNYQKMYAMGFLQLKDPFQSTSQKKPESAPMLKSLVSQNLWLFKHKKHGSSPIKKLISELEGDLEAVYVGQMCLSWEFLRWQYEKALDLWNSDPHRVHQYNEVAAEFQQFQVLLQRFTEDEPFQGTRVQSYVKSRCVLRNLLQVPVIREDYYCLEDKNTKREKENEEYVITSEMLVEIVEESIRIFWEFVRSDPNCAITSSSGHSKLPELHSQEDLVLLIELRKNLQKKDRKIKDILRSEKCILRKFQKREEDDSDEALRFFAQIDVKLVSRVYNMSRITRDQLIWCQEKLSKISFVKRKIYVEPAFLLFPC